MREGLGKAELQLKGHKLVTGVTNFFFQELNLKSLAIFPMLASFFCWGNFKMKMRPNTLTRCMH